MARRSLAAVISAYSLIACIGCHKTASEDYPALKSSCPKESASNSILPKYGIENKVAEFYTSLKFEKEIGDRGLGGMKSFLFLAYDSKSKNHEIFELQDGNGIDIFLRAGNFDVIEIFEKENSRHWKEYYSAVIYNLDKSTYVLQSSIGKNPVPNTPSVTCYDHWTPSILWETSGNILAEWVNKTIDSMEDEKSLDLPKPDASSGSPI